MGIDRCLEGGTHDAHGLNGAGDGRVGGNGGTF
jgi:hypothetical protein